MDKEMQQAEVTALDVTTKLKYRVAPDSAFVGKTVRIVITALNDTNANINFTDSDVIKISFPNTMVSSQNFKGSTPASSGYTVNSTVGENSFSVTVVFNDIVIRPQDSLTITFDQVPIAGTAGSTSVGIEENMGDVNTTQLPFTVQATGLGVIAWLDKLVIGKSETTNLNWYSSGGTSVVITGFPTGTGDLKFPASEQLMSTPVYVPDESQQWIYTATVYSASSHIDQTVTLQQNPPMINEFSSNPDTVQEIRIDDSAVLTWDTKFASSVILTTPLVPNERQRMPAAPLTVYPGIELQKAYKLNYAQLPASADFTLTANGYSKAASQSISFKIKPISLLYFKYADTAKTLMKFQTDPTTDKYSTWLLLPGQSVSTFVINQPGNRKDVFYLGSDDHNHPQIQYFEATANSGKFDLTWITANLTSLVLNPGNIPIQSGSIPNGTYTVDGPGRYTLTGTTAEGLSIDSILDVS